MYIFGCHEWRCIKETWLRTAKKTENYAVVNYDNGSWNNDDDENEDESSESQNAWFDLKNKEK